MTKQTPTEIRFSFIFWFTCVSMLHTLHAIESGPYDLGGEMSRLHLDLSGFLYFIGFQLIYVDNENDKIGTLRYNPVTWSPSL